MGRPRRRHRREPPATDARRHRWSQAQRLRCLSGVSRTRMGHAWARHPGVGMELLDRGLIDRASNGKHATCERNRTSAQDRGRPSRAAHTKTPLSPLEPGTSGVGPWYHPCLPWAHARRPCLHDASTARCSGPVTGAADPGGPSRRRLLPPGRVRDEARGSFSPAFLSPLHSNRGSLSPPCRVLVPVIARRAIRALSEDRSDDRLFVQRREGDPVCQARVRARCREPMRGVRDSPGF